ncbi:MAG: hypothetical protein ACI9NY_001447, partial [Kiritimatiellia bacterium]
MVKTIVCKFIYVIPGLCCCFYFVVKGLFNVKRKYR